MGVAVMVSDDIEVTRWDVLPRAPFPDRTLYADLRVDGRDLRVMGLHSVTGCDYRMAKSLQFLSFAEAVDELRPDIIGVDANEPRIDGHSADEMTFFIQKKGDVGAPTFFRTMEACGLRDSLMRGTYASAPLEGRCITCSHVINRGKARVRYDFVYLNEAAFEDYHCAYDYEGAVAAGSDHASVIVDAELNRST